MKVTTSLLMICMLAAAGAAGKSDRISATSEADADTSIESLAQPGESSTMTSTAQSDETSKWRYLPASTYVAPKVPI